jgi:peptidoglycan/xylan/chitin deacetylase (PgdA/CDA1 family)
MEACFHSFFSDRESSISRHFYMDVAQIRDLADHGCIGSHAHEHVPLGLLSEEKIFANLHLSIELLNSWTGQTPFALSYPYGSREACSVTAGEMAARFGFEFAFTMERAGNPDLRNSLFLARFDNNDLPGGKAAAWSVENLYQVVPSAKWYA